MTHPSRPDPTSDATSYVRWSRLARCIGGDLWPHDTVVAEQAALTAMSAAARPVPPRPDLPAEHEAAAQLAAALAVHLDLWVAGPAEVGEASDTTPDHAAEARRLLAAHPDAALAADRLVALTRAVWQGAAPETAWDQLARALTAPTDDDEAAS